MKIMKQDKIFMYYISDSIRHDYDEDGIKISRVKLTRPDNLIEHKPKVGEIIYGLLKNNCFCTTFEIINHIGEYYDIKISNGITKLYNFEKYENEEYSNKLKNVAKSVLNYLNIKYNEKLDLTAQYDFDNLLKLYLECSKGIFEQTEKGELDESIVFKRDIKNAVEDKIKHENAILITNKDVEIEFYKTVYNEEYIDKDEYFKSKNIIIKERENCVYKIVFRLPIHREYKLNNVEN